MRPNWSRSSTTAMAERPVRNRAAKSRLASRGHGSSIGTPSRASSARLSRLMTNPVSAARTARRRRSRGSAATSVPGRIPTSPRSMVSWEVSVTEGEATVIDRAVPVIEAEAARPRCHRLQASSLHQAMRRAARARRSIRSLLVASPRAAATPSCSSRVRMSLRRPVSRWSSTLASSRVSNSPTRSARKSSAKPGRARLAHPMAWTSRSPPRPSFRWGSIWKAASPRERWRSATVAARWASRSSRRSDQTRSVSRSISACRPASPARRRVSRKAVDHSNSSASRVAAWSGVTTT